MRPPICAVCDKDFRNDLDFNDDSSGLVQFSNYESLSENKVGHPQGLEWFCSKHYKKAKSLAHLSTSEALTNF